MGCLLVAPISEKLAVIRPEFPRIDSLVQYDVIWEKNGVLSQAKKCVKETFREILNASANV